MTEKQIQRVKDKIKAIRKVLADEKRRFGWYDDSRGLRYAPPALFLKIQDYKGAMTYFRWFAKNFPDDIGMPEFLLEWTVVLFKTGKLKDAEKKAMETFFANTYIFDKFFGLDVEPVEKEELSNLQRPEYTVYLQHSHEQEELQDFSIWLADFLSSEKFKAVEQEFVRLQKLLLLENPGPARSALLAQVHALESRW